MLKIITVLMFSLFVYFPSFAVGVSCKEPPQIANFELSPRLTYEVAGTGRLYFHVAPNEKCINKNIFVIPGDNLNAYAEFGEWSQVMFVSKTGEMIDGWVITKRLKFTGAFGMEMPSADLKFYTEAVKAANAGKLGSPFEKK